MNQFPQAPEYPIRAVSNFWEYLKDIRSSRCTTSAVDTGGKEENVQSEIFFIFLFRHLWVVELTYS
jgi:hypothetical protein